MSMMKSVYTVLEEWGIQDDFTEQDLWEAIAEANGVEYADIADGDLVDYL